jgi:hypothetical protein
MRSGGGGFSGGGGGGDGTLRGHDAGDGAAARGGDGGGDGGGGDDDLRSFLASLGLEPRHAEALEAQEIDLSLLRSANDDELRTLLEVRASSRFTFRRRVVRRAGGLAAPDLYGVRFCVRRGSVVASREHGTRRAYSTARPRARRAFVDDDSRAVGGLRCRNCRSARACG